MPSRSLCRPFDHMAPREAYRELLGARKISMAPPFVHMYYDGEGAAELNVRTNLSTRDVVSAFDIASLSIVFPFPPNPLWLAGLFSLRFYRFGLFSRLGGNWRAVIMDEQRALSYGG